MSQTIAIQKPKLILCDIEGTTTALTFVKEILFPYAKENVKDYLQKNCDNVETRETVRLLWEQYLADKDVAEDLPNLENFNDISDINSISSIVEYFGWQMKYDKKTTSLKQLQGHVWKYGYANGQIKSHVYEDVPRNFKKWISDGIIIGIYSSGSVLAQKLLFAFTLFGDLTNFITYYFDTNTGPKQSVDSYKSIAQTVKLSPSNILFLTDVSKEAHAAVESGMNSILMFREGVVLTDQDKKLYPYCNDFDQINFE